MSVVDFCDARARKAITTAWDAILRQVSQLLVRGHRLSALGCIISDAGEVIVAPVAMIKTTLNDGGIGKVWPDGCARPNHLRIQVAFPGGQLTTTDISLDLPESLRE
jgi:hypothetical protein